VEIFNKTIKNVTTKTYHYKTVDELKKHLMTPPHNQTPNKPNNHNPSKLFYTKISLQFKG